MAEIPNVSYWIADFIEGEGPYMRVFNRAYGRVTLFLDGQALAHDLGVTQAGNIMRRMDTVPFEEAWEGARASMMNEGDWSTGQARHWEAIGQGGVYTITDSRYSDQHYAHYRSMTGGNEPVEVTRVRPEGKGRRYPKATLANMKAASNAAELQMYPGSPLRWKKPYTRRWWHHRGTDSDITETAYGYSDCNGGEFLTLQQARESLRDKHYPSNAPELARLLPREIMVAAEPTGFSRLRDEGDDPRHHVAYHYLGEDREHHDGFFIAEKTGKGWRVTHTKMLRRKPYETVLGYYPTLRKAHAAADEAVGDTYSLTKWNREKNQKAYFTRDGKGGDYVYAVEEQWMEDWQCHGVTLSHRSHHDTPVGRWRFGATFDGEYLAWRHFKDGLTVYVEPLEWEKGEACPVIGRTGDPDTEDYRYESGDYEIVPCNVMSHMYFRMGDLRYRGEFLRRGKRHHLMTEAAIHNAQRRS